MAMVTCGFGWWFKLSHKGWPMSGMIIWGHHVEYKNSKSPTKPKTILKPLFRIIVCHCLLNVVCLHCVGCFCSRTTLACILKVHIWLVWGKFPSQVPRCSRKLQLMLILSEERKQNCEGTVMKYPRWWQLKYFFGKFSPRKLGKWSNLTNILQVGGSTTD